MIGKDNEGADERPTSAQSTLLKTHSCQCGQQLDICCRAHCPRCGRALDQS